MYLQDYNNSEWENEKTDAQKTSKENRNLSFAKESDSRSNVRDVRTKGKLAPAKHFTTARPLTLENLE